MMKECNLNGNFHKISPSFRFSFKSIYFFSVSSQWSLASDHTLFNIINAHGLNTLRVIYTIMQSFWLSVIVLIRPWWIPYVDEKVLNLISWLHQKPADLDLHFFFKKRVWFWKCQEHSALMPGCAVNIFITLLQWSINVKLINKQI